MNQASTPDIDIINGFIATQRRRDLRHGILLGFFSLALLASLWVAGTVLLQAQDFGKLLLPASTTLLAGILLLRQWRNLLATRQHYRNLGLPTRTAVERLLDVLRLRMRETRLLMGAVVLVMLPLFLLGAWQLVANGRMTGSDAMGFASLVVVACVSVLVVHWHRLRNQMAPLAETLRELQRQFD